MIDLDKDKAIVEEATDGPWGDYYIDPAEINGERYFISTGNVVICRIKNDVNDKPLSKEDEANAKHIAHFNPSYVAEYIQQVEALQLENKALKERVGELEEVNKKLVGGFKKIAKSTTDFGTENFSRKMVSQHNTQGDSPKTEPMAQDKENGHGRMYQ